jgi:uncharacterized protein YcfJ
MDNGWNPWKLTTIVLALLMATAVVTGLVVANWSGSSSSSREEKLAAPSTRTSASTKTTARSPQAAQAPLAPAVPTQEVIAACNRYAASQVGEQDKTKEVVKDAAIGAVVGAAVGAAGGAVADGGKGAGKGAAIGGILGAGGGTLYGLNENKKHDENYRAAYGSCMRSRGYTG